MGVTPPAQGTRGAGIAQRRSGQERRDERLIQLERLRTEVGRVQEALVRVQLETRRLSEIETTRRLTAHEVSQVSAVRRESNGLRLELALFRDEFERVRLTKPPATPPPATP